MDSSKVWARWTATKKDGTTVLLRVQDMPKSRIKDVIDFYLNYYVKNEAFHKAVDLSSNLEAVKEYQGILSTMLQERTVHVAICCLDDSPCTGEVLGVSCMALTKKDEDFSFSDLKLKTKECERFFELIEAFHNMCDVTKDFDIETAYEGRGLGVHPEYGRLGIATEFCKVRALACKEQGVPVTSAWMTSLGSQKAADRAGWETVFEVPFSELGKTLGIAFQGTPPSLKVMMKRI